MSVVYSYKYLGFMFTCNFSLTKALSDLCLRAKKALTEISVNIRKLGVISPDVFFKIFDSQVQPIFLNVGPQTPNATVYGECGRYPLFINSATCALVYWIKIMSIHEDRLPKRVYKMLLHMDNLGYKTWASEIGYLLFSHGFGIVWVTQSVGDSRSFINIHLSFEQKTSLFMICDYIIF